MINLKSQVELSSPEPGGLLRLTPAEAARRTDAAGSLAALWPATPAPRRRPKPQILLLQGPAGPFFHRLQRRLEARGFAVRRVCFNVGDRLFAGRREAIAFSGPLERWRVRFAELLREEWPDLVVLFGAERPVHQVARDLARSAGIRVLCLEEGYIRPGWITAELGGNNWRSPVAGQLPPPHWAPPAGANEAGAAGSGFRQSCFYAASYYGAQGLLNSRSEHDLLHRRVRASEIFFFARNCARKLAHAARDAATIRALAAGDDGQYFVVALQMPGDSQLGAAACGWTNERLVEECLTAFAAVGETGRKLVFKIHPLDRGHTTLARILRRRSRALGLADRVVVLHSGSAGTVIRHSAGLVTINSTAGLSAIFHGVPLLAVGRALYSNPDLARSGGQEALMAFLRGGLSGPDPLLRQRYLGWIREECLLEGDFYSRRGSALACETIAARVAELCGTAFTRADGSE